MLFKWNDKFKVNVPSIDEQHQRLFALGNELFKIASEGKGLDNYDKIMAVLSEMKNYAVYHFRHEEQLMSKYNFPGLDAHKSEHEDFIYKINEFSFSDIDENQRQVTLELLKFVADWIEKHILKSDHGYKALLNKNSAQ